MYVLNIHNMPKIFWGAWPLIIFERPKCSKVLVPLSKLSVSKNVWFTNARLGPLDFIHSEMLKRGMGGSGPSGKQPLGSTISGAGPPLGATKGYIFWLKYSDLTSWRHWHDGNWIRRSSQNDRKFHQFSSEYWQFSRYWLPSGKHSKNFWTWLQFIVDLPICKWWFSSVFFGSPMVLPWFPVLPLDAQVVSAFKRLSLSGVQAPGAQGSQVLWIIRKDWWICWDLPLVN